MANSVAFGRKAVVLAVIIGVAAMFVSSFIYRMDNPNLFIQAKQPQHFEGDGHDHGDSPEGAPAGMSGGAMSKVREFMARVEADPNDVEALIGLGNSFLMMRAWDRALDPLNKAIALEPNNITVLKGIGIAQFNSEKFTEAAKSYETILKIDPNDTLAMFNLGVINKHYFKNEAVSRTYFEKVLELEKEDTEMIKLAREELQK